MLQKAHPLFVVAVAVPVLFAERGGDLEAQMLRLEGGAVQTARINFVRVACVNNRIKVGLGQNQRRAVFRVSCTARRSAP